MLKNTLKQLFKKHTKPQKWPSDRKILDKKQLLNLLSKVEVNLLF